MDEDEANHIQALKGRNSPEDGSKETESQVLIELPILYFITTVLQFYFFLPPPGARGLNKNRPAWLQVGFLFQVKTIMISVCLIWLPCSG